LVSGIGLHGARGCVRTILSQTGRHSAS
jgi:hypothetical protein